MHSKFIPLPAIPLASGGGSRHKSSCSRLMRRCSKGPRKNRRTKATPDRIRSHLKKSSKAQKHAFQATSERKVVRHKHREALDLEHLCRRHDPVMPEAEDLGVPDQCWDQLRARAPVHRLRRVHKERPVSRMPLQPSMFPALPETTYQGTREASKHCFKKCPGTPLLAQKRTF